MRLHMPRLWNIDQGPVLDLTSGDSAVDHADLLAGVDLVAESGGVGRIQHLAFDALLRVVRAYGS